MLSRGEGRVQCLPGAAARRELPRVSRVVGRTLAAGSAAVAGMYAQRVAR